MTDSLEPTNPDLRSALTLVRSMTPRSVEDKERCNELSQRIFILMMQMRDNTGHAFDALQCDQAAATLKEEAIQLSREMPRPNFVLTLSDCSHLPLTEVEIDGDFRLQPYGHNTNSVMIPSGTKISMRTLAGSFVVLTLPGGVQLFLGLSEEHFPLDGIPVRAMPVSLSSEE